MMENGVAVRRSRRAASLTAQVLWNFQIEDDKNNNTILKPDRKSSICKEDFEKIPQIPTRRGRKRSIASPEDNLNFVPSPEFYGKKKKLAAGYSGHIFSITKPLLSPKQGTTQKKLTASVAPLVKSQPTTTTTFVKPAHSSSTTSPSNSNHINPILLLPVSLQANQPSGLGTHPSEVGGLSLVTLQASPDLFNCFGLNKPIMNPSTSQKQWDSSNYHIPAVPSIMDKLSAKIRSNMYSKHLPAKPMDEPQLEPLNLKMGETTVPSFKCSQAKPKVALVQPLNTTYTVTQQHSETDSIKLLVKRSVSTEPKQDFHSKTPLANKTKPQRRKSRASPVNFGSSTKQNERGETNSLKLVLKRSTSSEPKKELSSSTILANKVKPQRRKSRASPVNFENATKQLSALTSCKKRHANCPSPDYVCSSPDVDDVHREPRHTCTKKQINLRHKAAPAPGTRDYEVFVEMQRRLLAEAKRVQRAKARAKAKLQAKKEHEKRVVSIENRPITAVEPLKPQQTTEARNNGWTWTGKPYTSLVFSVEHSKYVPRRCYPGMSRVDKRVGTTDYVFVKDCVFLLPVGENELSYIAKVTALWEKPTTNEMMVSLVWYYRPEHTDDVSKNVDVSEDELFASRHQDEISVACVEERCNVQTYSQFCRIHARAQRDRMWKKDDLRRIVPDISPPINYRPMLPRETPMSSVDMFFCRHLYDVFQRRIKSKLPPPTSLTH